MNKTNWDFIGTEKELKKWARDNEYSIYGCYKRLSGIYVIELGGGVKIGRSSNLISRTISIISHDRKYGHGGSGIIAILGGIKNNAEIERMLHNKFIDKKIGCELFSCTIDDVKNALSDAYLPPSIVPTPEIDAEIFAAEKTLAEIREKVRHLRALRKIINRTPKINTQGN